MALTVGRVVAPSRELTAEELAILDVDAIVQVHNGPRARFLERVRSDWIKYTVKVANAVIEARPGTERRVKVRIPSSIRVALRQAHLEAFESGRVHVRQELQRQRTEVEFRHGPLQATGKPPISASLARLQRQSRAQIRKAEDVLIEAFASLVEGHKLAGTSRAGMRSAAATVAGPRADRDVLKIIDSGQPFAYNEGRMFEAAVQSEEIREEVYTAMLDSRTCVECERQDGRHAPLGTWVTPNPYCHGGALCRCFVYYVLKDEMKATRRGEPRDAMEALSDQLPPGAEMRFTDVDDMIANMYARELAGFARAHPGKLKAVTATEDAAQAVTAVSADGGETFVVKMSAHYLRDLKAFEKRMMTAQADGWAPAGLSGDALVFHPLRREMAQVGFALKPGVGDEVVEWAIDVWKKRKTELSLYGQKSFAQAYRDLYSQWRANPSSLDDEWKLYLDIFRGKHATIPDWAKPKPPAPPPPIAAPKPMGPALKKKTKKKGSRKEDPRDANRLKTQKAWEESVTYEERSAFRAWSGSAYIDMRKAQFSGQGDEWTLRQLRHMNEAFDRAPLRQRHVYRGYKIKVPKDRVPQGRPLTSAERIELQRAWADELFVKTDVFELGAHASTSTSITQATPFAGEFRVMLDFVKQRRGVKIDRFSSLPHEKEVIVQKGQRYRVTGVEARTDNRIFGGRGYLHVTLEELD